MRKSNILVVIFLMIVIQCVSIASAYALWANAAKLNSNGVAGVYAQHHIANRNSGGGNEWYPVIIEGKNSAGHATGFAFEATDSGPKNPGFNLVTHIDWPNTTAYDAIWYKQISTGVYHQLMASYIGSGYWNLYYDNNELIDKIWWGYYSTTSTTERTQIEQEEHGDAADYMGHVKNIQYKAANGNWYYQTKNDNVSLLKGPVDHLANPYSNYWINQKWEWEAEQPPQ